VRSVTEPIRVEFDVSTVAPAGATVEVGDLFLPDGIAEAGRPVDLVVCVPGGGMTRRYFDLPEHLPGRWSMARHLAEAHGLAVLTLDHLGVGDSPPPDDPYTLTPRVVAAVHAHVVADAVERLGAGTLVPGLLLHGDHRPHGVPAPPCRAWRRSPSGGSWGAGTPWGR
jgi:pimeloyl-ACP methyl ester carboxylesterase